MRVLHGLLWLQALAEALKVNTSLTSINLDRNEIGAEGCQAPPGGKGGNGPCWAVAGSPEVSRGREIFWATLDLYSFLLVCSVFGLLAGVAPCGA